MAAMFERYLDELHAQFDYLSTWLPNTHLELGDVGTLRHGKFERQTSLNELGIPFNTRERNHGIDLDYSSANNVSISVAGEAEPLPAAPLRVSVSFAYEHGVMFQAKACHTTEIADRHTLGQKILALAEYGQWPRNQVVVTELISTGPAVVLISNQNDARIELAAPLPAPAADALPLASASAALDVVNSRGIGVKIIAPDGLTPLFRASGIRRRLLGQDRFGHRGGGTSTTEPTTQQDGPAVFVELTSEDV